MKRISQWIGIIFISLTLYACASHRPAPEEAANKEQSSESRKTELSSVTNWYVKGSMGVKTEEDAFSASIYWKQRGKNKYSLQLFGPAGVGTLKVVSQGRGVTLTDNKNQTFHAKTGEELLRKQTGWYLPVSNMYYWARGMVVPDLPATPHYDKYHHLTSLEQQGWDIQYLRYTSVKGIDLPSKIFMNYQKLGIKIVISSWQLPTVS